MHLPGSECVLFICGAESLFLSAQDSGGAWLLHVKGDKSFEEEADRLGAESGTQPLSPFEVPPWVTSVALALQGNALQRGGMWTAAGIDLQRPSQGLLAPLPM